jgi:hypothetical protein
LVIQFFQRLSGVRIITYLNELDAELAQRDLLSVQATSVLNDDRLGVVG